MTFRWISLIALACLTPLAIPEGDTGHLQSLDPEFAKLIAPGAQIERIATGFTWTEGPVWKDGTLLFADIPSNSIRRWTPRTNVVRMFMQPSGWTEAKPFGGKESGSNGMTLDRNGRLTVAGHARRSVWRLETSAADGQRTVLAERFEGKRLNSPNDVVYRADGSLYFTDPPYGLATQSDNDPAKELTFSGVYRIPHAFDQTPGSEPANGALQLLTRELPRPNGIAFSPDEKLLYASNSEPKKIWMRYQVAEDGSLRNGKLFFDASAESAEGSPDGLKVDLRGNMYSAGPGGVWVFSPKGTHLGTIVMPEKTANVAWGDADGKTLYITASSGVYRVKCLVGGKKP